jgi:D-arabinono-1,4-lactone oxidase
MLLASLLFVLFGNSDHARIVRLLHKNSTQYLVNMIRISAENHGRPSLLGANLTAAGVIALGWLLGWFPGIVKALYRYLLPLFTTLGTETDFRDWYWRSLCMDNTADDVMLGTEFVEIWAPIQYTQQIMNLLQGMFDAKGATATGYYAQEIYAAAPSPGWLNPSYSDGTDEYKDGVSRFDVYWYRDNEGSPDAIHAFFSQYWDLLRDNGVSFRFHWGKFVPYYDFPQWAAYYRASLPMFDAFMALREQRDPQGIFLTTYWRNVLLGGPPNG